MSALQQLKNACFEAIYHAEGGHLDHAEEYLEMAKSQIPILRAIEAQKKDPAQNRV